MMFPYSVSGFAPLTLEVPECGTVTLPRAGRWRVAITKENKLIATPLSSSEGKPLAYVVVYEDDTGQQARVATRKPLLLR